MSEFDVDMGYLLEEGELDSVILNDENGEHEPMEFLPSNGECELAYGENDYGDDGWWCKSCGEWFAASFRHTGRNNIIKPSYCQHCGKAVKR